MVLTAHEKFIDTKEIECLFTQGEKFSDRIHFVLPPVNNDVDVSGCAFAIRTVASDGGMTETVLDVQHEGEQILLTWNVPETVTAVPGMLQLELVGSRGTDVIIKYKMPAVYVKAAIMGDHLPSPDIIEEKLAQMNDILAQAQAKLDEAKNVALDIIDPTLTISGKAADAKVTGDRFTELTNAIENISSGGNIQEIIDARTSSISGEEFPSLSERLESDFSYLKKVMQAVEIISSYVLVDIERGDDTESEYYANDTLRITGVGSIEKREFMQREDFGNLEINIGGDVGEEAFYACANVNTVTVNCRKISNKAFYSCPNIRTLNIGKDVTEIGSEILWGILFEDIVRIAYDGTIAEWNAVTKATDWIYDKSMVKNGVVECTDGTVEV